VAYHDIFRYPVTAAEIWRFLDQPVSREQLSIQLEEMVAASQLYVQDGLYTAKEDPSLIERRHDGNIRAAELLPIGYCIGRFLGKFPFVRGVGISGSLSKDFADDQADIDYFIITKANRLWIARTLLHCLKKLSFLIGKQHWFCMNYFIDEDALLMPEQNLFIAIETTTLKPVSGKAIPAFFSANLWARKYFPNQRPATVDIPDGDSWPKRTLEWLLNVIAGERLDNWLMRLTHKRWQRKEQQQRVNSKGFPLALRIAKHYGRPNPEHLQKKILGMYAEKSRTMPPPKPWADVVSIPVHFFRKEII
jgi:hypothetical protein